jgi:predicted lactoylglutathione lyase
MEVSMDQETLNLSIRKFLKTVGVSSQREIEQAVAKAIEAGTIGATETLAASMTLRIGGLQLEVRFDGEIHLQ